MGCVQATTLGNPHGGFLQTYKNKQSNMQLLDNQSEIYVLDKRAKMRLQVKGKSNFLTHHLQNQVNLSPYASSRKIRARQILQHIMFKDLSHNKIAGQLHTSKLTQFALKAWFQRTFLECLQRAERGYFQQGRSYEQVRQQLAEQYIFQIYQMGQFINAGFGKFSDDKKNIEVPLSLILLGSDSSLYPLLQNLQQKYPLVSETSDINYPTVETISKNINLLSLIKSQAYADPQHLNIQTLMNDLRLLIDEANDSFDDFQNDMIGLLGEGTLTDCKVKRGEKNGKRFYNASAVRRVFIKWAETLLERIPQIYVLPQFMEFIRSKKKMAEQFIFKSSVSETTHQQVIECLSLLLESVKYQIGTTKPRQQFGLFLYDLLRCKITRQTGQEIVGLLEVLKNTHQTVSGKRFQVVRIKNRFKNATRDLLINFRYGEYLIGEAQLCIDGSHEQPIISKKIKFRHYLYQLERGIYGPTYELIMQYEDFARKDIVVHLEAEGQIQKRGVMAQTNTIKRAGRVCPQGHSMIAIKGNIFRQNQNKFSIMQQRNRQSNLCDFCYEKFSMERQYHYCYYCSLFYCLKCLPVYNNTDMATVKLICTRANLLQALTSQAEIDQRCKQFKAIVVVFYSQGRPSSRLFLDQIIYLLSTYSAQKKSLPNIYCVSVGNKLFEQGLKRYKITRVPTTLLLDEQSNAQVTLEGCTFHDIEAFFDISQRIINGLSKGLRLKCNICGQIMSNEGEFKQNADEKCQICLDSNKVQDLEDFIVEVKNKVGHKKFICKFGHIQCKFCSYLSHDQPSYFRDHTGRSYIFNKVFQDPPQCSNNHKMQIVYQPNKFNCYQCKMIVEQTAKVQIGRCQRCNEWLCIQCLQSSNQNFREKKIKQHMRYLEIVSHFVQNKSESSYPCGCGKLFLKVYQTRKIHHKNNKQSLVEFQKKKNPHHTNLNSFNLMDFLVYFTSQHWACRICGYKSSKLQLHLACFYCTYAQSRNSNNHVSHTQICISCCIKSGLVSRILPTKVDDRITNLKCHEGHRTTLTSLSNAQQLSFECFNCHKNYYPYTERYQCKSCKIRCCLSCSSQSLVDEDTPITQKTCSQSHKLIFVNIKPPLQFCNKCSIYLQGKHFKCHSSCNYYLCVQCAQKQ